jgi:hypothetical protein
MTEIVQYSRLFRTHKSAQAWALKMLKMVSKYNVNLYIIEHETQGKAATSISKSWYVYRSLCPHDYIDQMYRGQSDEGMVSVYDWHRKNGLIKRLTKQYCQVYEIEGFVDYDEGVSRRQK